MSHSENLFHDDTTRNLLLQGIALAKEAAGPIAYGELSATLSAPQELAIKIAKAVCHLANSLDAVADIIDPERTVLEESPPVEHAEDMRDENKGEESANGVSHSELDPFRIMVEGFKYCDDGTPGRDAIYKEMVKECKDFICGLKPEIRKLLEAHGFVEMGPGCYKKTGEYTNADAKLLKALYPLGKIRLKSEAYEPLISLLKEQREKEKPVFAQDDFAEYADGSTEWEGKPREIKGVILPTPDMPSGGTLHSVINSPWPLTYDVNTLGKCGKQGCGEPAYQEFQGSMRYLACDKHAAEIQRLVLSEDDSNLRNSGISCGERDNTCSQAPQNKGATMRPPVPVAIDAMKDNLEVMRHTAIESEEIRAAISDFQRMPTRKQVDYVLDQLRRQFGASSIQRGLAARTGVATAEWVLGRKIGECPPWLSQIIKESHGRNS